MANKTGIQRADKMPPSAPPKLVAFSSSAPTSSSNSPVADTSRNFPATAPSSSIEEEDCNTLTDQEEKREVISPVKDKTGKSNNDLSEFYHKNLKAIKIRIDNIPPGKSWKQVRYLIGGFIHHTALSHVNILSPMIRYDQPFNPIQSCIVYMESSTTNSQANELVKKLDLYIWEGYTIRACVIPKDIFTPGMATYPAQNSMSVPTPMPPPLAMNVPFQAMMPILPYQSNSMSPLKGESIGSSSPEGEACPSRQNSNSPPKLSPPSYVMFQPSMVPPMMGNMYGMGPPMPPLMRPQNGRPHPNNDLDHICPMQGSYQNVIPQPFVPRNQMLRPSNWNMGPRPSNIAPSYSSNSYINGTSYPINGAPMLETSPSSCNDIALMTSSKSMDFRHSKNLKVIFNERNFRKQMTERDMFQLKIGNFPPHLIPDTLNPVDGANKVDLETNHMETFVKLRWTILKDFVKQKCPELVKLQNSSSSSFSMDNTKEFYVGVYEEGSETLLLKLNQQLYSVEAVNFGALIGFKDKTLFEMCYDILKGIEYAPNYNLTVTKLAPQVSTEGSREIRSNGKENKNNSGKVDDSS